MTPNDRVQGAATASAAQLLRLPCNAMLERTLQARPWGKPTAVVLGKSEVR
jgi:hypothetical protein